LAVLAVWPVDERWGAGNALLRASQRVARLPRARALLAMLVARRPARRILVRATRRPPDPRFTPMGRGSAPRWWWPAAGSPSIRPSECGQ
jgi:hypothetical protein